jgi:hypothetical protein
MNKSKEQVIEEILTSNKTTYEILKLLKEINKNKKINTKKNCKYNKG